MSATRTVCAGLAAVALAGGCPAKSEETKGDAGRPTAVEVLRLKPQSIARSLRYDADLRGAEEVRVFSQVTDRIAAIKVEEGDAVRKGQILALVRSDTLRYNVRSATAALAAARADRDNLKRELVRQRKLLSRRIVSQAQVDQLRSRLLAAEAQLRRMEALESQAAAMRGNAVVRAPIGGVVGTRHLSAGDMAAPTLPIFTIVQAGRLKIVLPVPEQHLALIRVGMSAAVKVARHGERRFPAKVVRIAPVIDRQTRTARVQLELDNSAGALLPGMLARVEIEVERHDGVVVVPYRSLNIRMGRTGAAEHGAFVVAGGKAVERVVRVGLVDGARVEVTAGLAAGELLVTRGQHLLKEGSAVRVVQRVGRTPASRPARPGSASPTSRPRAERSR